jgi:hypothetical protein
MTGEELIQQLQAKGLLDEKSAKQVKRDALLTNESVETIIFKQHIIDDAKIAELKSSLLNVP